MIDLIIVMNKKYSIYKMDDWIQYKNAKPAVVGIFVHTAEPHTYCMLIKAAKKNSSSGDTNTERG